METIHDPEWTDEDIAAALDWQHEQSLLCSGCGHPADETLDDEIRAAWITEKRTCWACASKERTQANDSKKGARPHGVKYVPRNRAKEVNPDG